MIPNEVINRITKIAEEVAAREGCKIYDIEFIGAGKGRTLRVYLDKENGVGIDECSNVSRGLNLMLDVEDVIPGGAYNLEVSSPGLERYLKKPSHFQVVIGKKIFSVEEQKIKIPYSEIEKSQLVFEVEKGQKK
jgi:ribosome maturation factor RimP